MFGVFRFRGWGLGVWGFGGFRHTSTVYSFEVWCTIGLLETTGAALLAKHPASRLGAVDKRGTPNLLISVAHVILLRPKLPD